MNHQAPGRHCIVVDLGFGDAGKGSVCDFLVRRLGASLVVRFNGGAQASHNVVAPDGRHHAFAQFGSGTLVLPPARTHLTADVVVDPLALLYEARILERRGVSSPLQLLTIDARALVITPFHRALNQLRELARGQQAHGTCGVGVGETRYDFLKDPDGSIVMGDLTSPDLLKSKWSRVRTAKYQQARDLDVEHPKAAQLLDLFEDDGLQQRWIDAVAPLNRTDIIVDHHRLGRLVSESTAVVWEGAQGVLLDEWRGFHPHTTWSTCTTALADELLAAMDVPSDSITRIGVLRSYHVRHGPGPFPSESRELEALPEPHNAASGWQGRFRRGWFDTVLASYALEVCPVDWLALTHLDVLSIPTRWGAVVGYSVTPNDSHLFELDEAGRAVRIRPGPWRDLGYQQALTTALMSATPQWQQAPRHPVAWVSWLEQRLGRPVGLVSTGPKAADKSFRRQVPGRSGVASSG